MVYLKAADLDLDTLVTAFSPATQIGRTILEKRLAEPVSDLKTLEDRQSTTRTIKNLYKTNKKVINDALHVLRSAETDVVSVGEAADDERLKDYYTQILWDRKSIAARLNHLGWLNEIIVFLRTIFIPGLSVMLPLFIFVAPILVFFMLKEPITIATYMDMIQGAIKKAVPSVLGAPRFKGAGGLAETAEQFVHIGLAIAMLGASIWNQVSAAIHMRSIVADMRKRAESVQAFTEATQTLSNLLGIKMDHEPWSIGPLGVFGDAWNKPERIQTLLDHAGYLDMLISVAKKGRTCMVTYDTSDLALEDVYHPGLSQNKRIFNSLIMSEDKSHVLLTGPNRGGKSTLLKSVGYAVLMAQTLGVVFARKATIPIFDSIITALTPSDVVGSMSLFEAEIEFAKAVKSRFGQGRTFLMMDEIFHGTNAHDGVEAAQVFLDQVYVAPAVFSIVSTHYMELPNKYDVQKLCMEASIDPDDSDKLVYTYRLITGVNKHSSVREILRERGLLSASAVVPAVVPRSKSIKNNVASE